MNAHSGRVQLGQRGTATQCLQPRLCSSRRRFTKPVITCVAASSNDKPVLFRDQLKEEFKVYRRNVYDFDQWANHRSTYRYIRHMQTITSSGIVKALIAPTMWVIAVSAVVGAYETALAQHMLPVWAPELTFKSPQPLAITSFAVSLLLVFRTTNSYLRWDEARKMWGGLLNRSRDITRQAAAFFGDATSKRAFARWTVAFARSLKCHLRDDGNFEEELKRVLKDEELQMLLATEHKPVTCMQVMGEIIVSEKLKGIQTFQMGDNLTYYQDVLGGCERILRTPIPVSYTRHTGRFLMIWLTCLPLTMWPLLGWVSLPTNALIALLLLGIEEIGVQIEEPFGVLALEVICNRIETDVFAQVEQDVAVKRHMAKALPAEEPVRVERQAARSRSWFAASNGANN